MVTKTIEDLLILDKDLLTPSDVSGVLKTNAHTLSLTARQQPNLIGFQFFFSGNRMKIPRVPFLRFMGVVK